MTTWLRIALAAQLLFFGAWAAQLLTSHRTGTIVWLATEPVDPRDLLSGHYVALRYRIGDAATTQCGMPVGGGGEARMLYVQLAVIGDPVVTAEGPAVTAEPIGCQTFPPAAAREEIWIAGRFDPASGRLTYGIERMFVAEDSPLRTAQTGSVTAKVAINEQFTPRLLGLAQKTDPTIVPPSAEP